jgi:hypothetical protein
MTDDIEQVRHVDFADVVATLRAEGWKDWQILIAVHNVAKSARHTFTASAATRAQRQAMVDKFMAPEPDDDPISPSSFTVDALRQALSMASASSAMNVWNLRLRPQTPPSGVLELLRSRYGWADDDVEHDDPFVEPANVAR